MRLFERRVVNKNIYKDESNRMAENVPNEDLQDVCCAPIKDEMGEHVARMGETDIWTVFFSYICVGMKLNRVLKKLGGNAWIGFIDCV